MRTSKRKYATEEDLFPQPKRAKRMSQEQRQELEAIDLSDDSDSKYVSCCLGFLFTTEELRSHSYGGNISNFNKKSHPPLDAVRLKYIEGMFKLPFFLFRIFHLCSFLQI